VANVVVDGESLGSINSYTFEDVSANHTIAASFSLNEPATLSKPVLKPRRPVAGRRLTVTGTLSPRHEAGTTTELRFYRKVGARYRLAKTASAVNADFGDLSGYTARLKLRKAGYWKVLAVHTDEEHAFSSSPPARFRVR